jgi:prepilin-type N-terminal cleavage/methylation domain-containing protein
MARSRSSVDGFTLLEALVALVVVGAVVVVGLETVGLGAAARARAVDYADLRRLAEQKLAEISLLDGSEIEALPGKRSGRFEPPYDDAEWELRVTEVEAGTGLFQIDLEVHANSAALEVSTYLDRFGELWAGRARPRP